MIRVLFRLFRAIGLTFVGRLDGWSRVLEANPVALRANFDEIIRDKKARMNQFVEAVGTIVAQEEKKSQHLKTISNEITRLERLKAGATQKAKERAAELQAAGTSPDVIAKDEVYLSCKKAFADFSSTLKEKEARAAELETDIKQYGETIKGHKLQLQQLQREIEKLKTEAADTVADIISATEEQQIKKALSGISEDNTSVRLEELRDMRARAKAQAKVVSQLAGTDTKIMETEFEQFAAEAEADHEFDDMIGLNLSPERKLERVEERLEKLKETPVAE